LHNNSVGDFIGDPSVAGRMRAFEDGMEKLLWPEKRPGAIYRTTQTSWLYVNRSYLPKFAFDALRASFRLPKTADTIMLGPIPKDTPVNLLANIDLDLRHDRIKLLELGSTVVKLNTALREIREQKLDDAAAAARLKEFAPALLKLSKCPDLVTDHGHPFGTGLADADKRALIAYLKRL
jgi:hypothetical protein